MTTKEEVLRLAESVGLEIDDHAIYLSFGDEGVAVITELVTKLIELAKAQGAAEEREACAKLCEQFAKDDANYGHGHMFDGADACAKSIRNRGQHG